MLPPQHGGQLPKNYKEKEGLRQLIRDGILRSESGVPELEENFDEALKSVNVAVVPTRISSEVQGILEDPACVNLKSEVFCLTEGFFFMCAQALLFKSRGHSFESVHTLHSFPFGTVSYFS